MRATVLAGLAVGCLMVEPGCFGDLRKVDPRDGAAGVGGGGSGGVGGGGLGGGGGAGGALVDGAPPGGAGGGGNGGSGQEAGVPPRDQTVGGAGGTDGPAPPSDARDVPAPRMDAPPADLPPPPPDSPLPPVCSAPMHMCSGRCVPNDVAACGAPCTVCMAPDGNSTPTCNGTGCDFNCRSGFHKCNNRCVDNTAVATCGDRCAACETSDPNATPACSSGQCDITCRTGFHKCGSGASARCADNNAIATCGSRCTACMPPANAIATCDGTNCGFRCDFQVARCTGDTCRRLRWLFDGGSTEGWALDSRSTMSTTVSVRAAPAGGQGGALAMPINFPGGGNQAVFVKVALCPDANNTDLRQASFSARSLLEGPALPPEINTSIQWWTATTARLSTTIFSNGGERMNTWFDMGVVTTGGVQWEAYVACTDVLMVFQISGAAWTGTWWIDNVTITPQ